MTVVIIGCSLEEIIISCGGTLIKNIKTGEKSSLIITKQKNTIEENKLQRRMEKMGIKITVMKNFDFFTTTQNNVNLIYNGIEKNKPDTIIIPHNKSKKKENSVLGSSSILAGRQIKNILMYETEITLDKFPTIIQNIEKVNKIKMQLIDILCKNRQNKFNFFLKKVKKIIKEFDLKQKSIEPYHSFRMVLE